MVKAEALVWPLPTVIELWIASPGNCCSGLAVRMAAEPEKPPFEKSL